MNSSGKLRVRAVAVNDISSDMQVKMYKLFSRYYEDVSLAQFQTDMAEKNHVLVVLKNQQKMLSKQLLKRAMLQR